jgi:hypothetical protein
MLVRPVRHADHRGGRSDSQCATAWGWRHDTVSCGRFFSRAPHCTSSRSPGRHRGAGIQAGWDIILEVQGIPLGADLENGDRIREVITGQPAGTIIRVKVLWMGEIIELVATTPL